MIATYQKHEQVVERVGGAAGLALLVYVSGLLALYPAEWRLVVPVAIFIVGCASLPSAYLLTVAAIGYPLATLSIYFAALFLAVAILPMWYALHNIWAVLLIAAAPLLGGLGLGFVAPLAAGLLMSRREGLIVGGGSYFSLWLLGALTYPPDTSHAAGPLDALQGRFGGANSFETIGRVLGPLNPNSTILLDNILHMAIWAAAGYAVAVVSDFGAEQAERRASLHLFDNRERGFIGAQIAWHALLPLVAGGAILIFGLSLIPALLSRPLNNVGADLLNYGSAVLLGGLLALTLWLALWCLRQPFSAASSNPSRREGSDNSPTPAGRVTQAERPTLPGATRATIASATPAPRVAALAEPPARPRTDDGERVIMIEID